MLFTEVMERLEVEERALKDGKGSRMNWRILTILYCIKVGNYGNLLTLLLDLSERAIRGERFSRPLMTEMYGDFRNFLKGLGEESRDYFRGEMTGISDRVEAYGHWWWREMLSAVG